ncbi:WXG100 family type VII secretion target [Saccharopolyspora shandongensis]|uniref:WXG100 family type VII secretion target n=1 Tax=Saccharopolyspora shandongensis TaxID=418495 RepID=UPI0033DEA13B
MSDQTRLVAERLNAISTQHDNTGEEVKSTRTSLGVEIATMASQNKGAMIKALNDVHMEWDRQCLTVENELHAMAQAIRDASAKYQSQDQDQAEQVRRTATTDSGRIEAGPGLQDVPRVDATPPSEMGRFLN